MNQLFGVDELVNWAEVAKLLSRLALDLIVASAVIRLVYFRLYRSREYVFTFYMFNLITMSLCLLLRKVPTELGFALALFSVFGILRYRTEQIRSRDLTYLFIVIGIGIVNGVAAQKVSLAELLVVNAAIVAMTALLERRQFAGSEASVPMFYDRVELLQPGRESELNTDLMARTGLRVRRIEVQRIDLLRDAAEITIFYQLDGLDA